MRLFLVIMLLFALPASAADLFNKKVEKVKPPEEMTAAELSNNYFKNCVAKEHEILTDQSKEMLCACSAAQLSAKMNADQIRAMATDTPEGQNMRNKMLLEVYAPCIEFPTHDLVLNRCLNDQTTLKQKTQICKCMAQGMAQYIAQNAQIAIMGALQENPKTLDPLGALLNSPSFDARGKQVLAGCIQRHVL